MKTIAPCVVLQFDIPATIASILFALRWLLHVVAAIFVLSGLDDLFIDLVFWTRALVRWLGGAQDTPPTEDSLSSIPEKPVAIMIPAWDESAVIGRMLENTVKSVIYSQYRIFVGTYPNDEATRREVDRIRERLGNVEQVVCPHDGPTTKADCLNWLYQGILDFEKANGLEFAIFAMDDSEDVVHPLALKLFNFLIPRHDMIQLPVFALESGLRSLTAGHYADEFADNHMKVLVVREALAQTVPSAGVGCAFSRRAMCLSTQIRRDGIFNVRSLTEDYEFSLHLTHLGLRSAFIKCPVERTIRRRSFWTGRVRSVTVREYVAIRGHFPFRFQASVRQKTRWIIGIALQAWQSFGWKGGLRIKYMLVRDRKTLLTSQANMWGYLAVVAVSATWLVSVLFPEAYRYRPLVERGTLLWYLILVSTIFLFVRIAQRFHSVLQVYGFAQGCLSIPRLVWGNFINFFATTRAIRIFLTSKRSGTHIAWDKTAHIYPSESELLSLHGAPSAENGQ